MNAKEVKNVIKGSIFNADLQKQAMDFVDAQEKRIVALEDVLNLAHVAMQKVRDEVPEIAYFAIATLVPEWSDAWDAIKALKGKGTS